MKDGMRDRQAEAARILGVCERSFRRYLGRYETDGIDGLIDRRLEQASNRQVPVDEVMALTDEYRRRYMGWKVKHFHSGMHARVARSATPGSKGGCRKRSWWPRPRNGARTGSAVSAPHCRA